MKHTVLLTGTEHSPGLFVFLVLILLSLLLMCDKLVKFPLRTMCFCTFCAHIASTVHFGQCSANGIVAATVRNERIAPDTLYSIRCIEKRMQACNGHCFTFAASLRSKR